MVKLEALATALPLPIKFESRRHRLQRFLGSGKYVVISLSSLQARIVMMNEVPNSSNMIF